MKINKSFKLPEDQVKKAQEMGLDLPNEFRKLLAKLVNSEVCPTCNQPLKKESK